MIIGAGKQNLVLGLDTLIYSGNICCGGDW